jgi:hypothetical protein
MDMEGSMPRQKKPKDKFAALADTFKDAVAQSSPEEIHKRISDIALLDCALRDQLKEDGDVESAREALKNLMEPYREDFKSFRLQIDYARSILDAKGAA